MKADHYTMSIMLNALKRHGSSEEAQRILAALDARRIQDRAAEVLMNTVIEVRIQRGESHGLQDWWTAYQNEAFAPLVRRPYQGGGRLEAHGRHSRPSASWH